jgi:hypothetical protein
VATDESAAKQPSIADKMAVIDCQCSPSAKTVAVYQHLLEKLVVRKCTEKPIKLADELVNTRDILAQDGKGHYKLLTIMRALDKSIPDKIGFKQKCAGVLAALIVLMEKG